MTFDRTRFFDGYRAAFGPLTQSQVDGLTVLLGFIENDPHMTDVRHIAYLLATTYHEAAHTWHPIEEYRKGHGRPYGTPDAQGRVWYGRGYCQLTWRRNYEKMDAALGLNGELVRQPALALRPDVAYQIMSHGMRRGSFTGKALRDYIKDDRCDYRQARRIINGTDRANEIADFARRFETILRAAEIIGPPTAPHDPTITRVDVRTVNVPTVDGQSPSTGEPT